MTARSRLKFALKGSDRARLEGLCSVAGVSYAIARRATVGSQPVGAEPYLNLCAALDRDPVTLLPRLGQHTGSIHWASLGMAARAKRMAPNEMTLRRAATLAKISFSALGRVERGELVSIETLITVCKWLNRHPSDFVAPDASREKSTGTQVAA